MNKQFVCLTLLFSVAYLQASLNNQRGKQTKQVETISNSTGGNFLLPVAPQSSDEETVHGPVNSLQSSHGLVSVHDDDEDFDDPLNDYEEAQSSQKISPNHNNGTNRSSKRFLPEAPPAIACQTTMRNFHTPSSQEGNADIDDDKDTRSESDQEIETEGVTIEGVEGMVVNIQPSFIQRLEQIFEQQSQEKRTLIYSAIDTLKKLGALEALEKTKDFARHLTQQRLQRILSLDDTFKLREHLATFTTEADQGEWLAKGLAQAIDTKNINDITRMLEIIQNNKLTNFVPTQHQEDAAQLLLQHTKKIISNILPQAQRTSNPGDLSPRSKATHATLTAIWQAYDLDPREENNSSTMVTILQQLKLKNASTIAKK